MAIQTPEGTRDMLPDEVLYWEHFKGTAQELFGRYGYVTIETPLFEQTDLFVRGIGEATDIVGKEMFQVLSGANLEKLVTGDTIKNKSRLSLRPEGTASVVRAVVQHDLVPQGAAPAKLMYAGPMFRAERPQKGRYREFYQIGIECLGADAPTIDAEAIIMLVRFFETVGILPSTMKLLINSMGCEKCRPAYRDLVRDYMKMHEDELCDECKRRADTNPLRAFDCKNPACAQVMEGAPKITDHLCEECETHHMAVKGFLDEAGLSYVEDWRLVRGFDYYMRTVFEVQVVEGLGSQNAIGGGGRYDKLSEEIGGRPTPGLGFALGYERCALALEAQGYAFPELSLSDAYIACVDDSVRPAAFALLQKARDAGLKVEMDHQGRSLKSQFKVADKLDVHAVLILGPDEMSQNKVKMRNMNTREEVLIDINEAVTQLAALLQ